MLTGTVQRVSTKDVKTKFGMKKTYSLQIDGTWYSCGFTDPRAGVGEEVAFEANSGPYGEEIVKGTLIRTGASVPSAVHAVGVERTAVGTAPKSAAPGGRDRPFPVPALHGDRAIIRQNALAHATRLVDSCAVYDSAGEVDVDKTVERVIHIARRFEAYSCGDLDAAMAADMINKAKKVAAKAAVETELGE